MKDEPKYYGVWFEPIVTYNWLNGSDGIPIVTSKDDAIQRASEMNRCNKSFRYTAKPIDFLPVIGVSAGTSVFAITCSAHSNPLREAKLYSSQDKAQAAMKEIAKDRSGKLGVHVMENELDRFSFILGWEERKVSFAIVELSVE